MLAAHLQDRDTHESVFIELSRGFQLQFSGGLRIYFTTLTVCLFV